MDQSTALTLLSRTLEAEGGGDFPLLGNTDAWIISSLLQKAIRRGDKKIAQAAALRFFALRRSAVWRRLIIIGFEDVGAGDVDILATIVAAASSPQARKRAGGDERVLLALVRMMSEVTKDRSADFLTSAARSHPSSEAARVQMIEPYSELKLKLVADTSQQLMTRAVAAWLLYSVEWPGENRLELGALSKLIDTFRESGVPEEIAEATRLATLRTRHPLCLMVPLVWHAARCDKAAISADCKVPPTLEVQGVPTYALDFHTRLGKAAIRQFVCENKAVRSFLANFLPEYRAHQAAFIAAYYVDAAPVARRLMWDGSKTVEWLGIEADMFETGLEAAAIEPLLKVFKDNLDHLNDVRFKLLKASMK